MKMERYLCSRPYSVVAVHLRGHGKHYFFGTLWTRRCASTTTLLNRYMES